MCCSVADLSRVVGWRLAQIGLVTALAKVLPGVHCQKRQGGPLAWRVTPLNPWSSPHAGTPLAALSMVEGAVPACTFQRYILARSCRVPSRTPVVFDPVLLG